MHEHVVDSLEWTVGFPSESAAFDWQGRLCAWLRGPAVEVIDQVLNEFDRPRQVLCIDRLELNLGRLSPTDWSHQVAGRLREALREELAHRLGTSGLALQPVVQAPSDEEPASLHAQASWRHRHLVGYLAQGHLSWSAGRSVRLRLGDWAAQWMSELGSPHPKGSEASRRQSELLGLLRRSPAAWTRWRALTRGPLAVLHSQLSLALSEQLRRSQLWDSVWPSLRRLDPAGLASALRRLGRDAGRRARWAQHWADVELLDLIEPLVGTEREFVAQVMAHAQAWAGEAEANTAKVQTRVELWAVTLAYVMVEQGSEFNRRSYLASVLRQRAATQGVAAEDLWRWVRDALAQQATKGRWSAQLLRTWESLGAVWRRPAPVRPVAMLSLADQTLLERQLDEPIAWSPDAVAAWKRARALDPQWLWSRLRTRGQAQHRRALWARLWTPPLLEATIDLGAPGQGRFVAEVVAQAPVIARLQDPPGAAAGVAQRLWLLSLSYLLVQRGSEFNRRSYLAHLLGGMARSIGRPLPDFLDVLLAQWQAVPNAPGLPAGLRQLLQALRAQWAGALSDPGAAPMPAPAPGVVEMQLAWAAMVARGEQAGARGQAMWQALVGAAPQWMLERSWALLRSDSLRQGLADHWNEDGLQALLNLLAPGAGDTVAEVAWQAAGLAQTTSWPRSGTAAGAGPTSEATGRTIREALSGLGERVPKGEGAHAEVPLAGGAGQSAWRGGAARVRRRVWVFAMAYLSAERGSEFNRRSFLARWLQHWAVREGLRYRDLLAQVRAALHASMPGGQARRQLLDVAARLWADLGADQAASAAEEDARRWQQWQARLVMAQPLSARERAHWQPWVRARLERAARESNTRARLHQMLDQARCPDARRLIVSVLLDALDAGPEKSGLHGSVRPMAAWWPAAKAWALHEQAMHCVLAGLRAAGLTPPAGVVKGVHVPSEDRRAIVPGWLDAEASRALARTHALAQSLSGRVPPHQGAAQCLALEVLLRQVGLPTLRRWVQADPRKSWRTAGWDAAAIEFLWRRLNLRVDPADPQKRPAQAPGARRTDSHSRSSAASPRRSTALQPSGRRSNSAREAAHATPQSMRKPARERLREPGPRETAEPPLDVPIYVSNAGLVLAEPFLPRLLSLRGLVQTGRFVDARAAARACLLLHALVQSEPPASEDELVLNKLLCGMPLTDAIEEDVALDADDHALAESLLGAVIAQWKSLGRTSVETLRETFLRREGRLVQKADHWLLVVQNGPYDMLIDQVPWGFSTIRYPWMEKAVHVQWR